MPRKVAEAPITNRTGRARLPPRAKPYYRLIAGDLQLGYYRPIKTGRPGSWIARRYLGDGRYETTTFGVADDDPRAAPTTVLDHKQAQDAARAWHAERATIAARAAAAEGAPTVRTVVLAYVVMRKSRAERAGHDAELRLSHHVLTTPIADVPLPSLSESHLTIWREGLRRGGRARRTEAPPLAPATLARLLNDFRAALTAGARKARIGADVQAAWREGLRAPEAPDRARPRQVLPDADVMRVVRAARAVDCDFGDLIMMLAATGARQDQAARLNVGDFQGDARRIMVPISRKGKGRKAETHIAVPLPDDVVVRLREVVAGRAAHEPLLMRWHHRQASGAVGTSTKWEQAGRRVWATSSELTRPWRKAVKAAGLAADLVPYSLRHSSIVRALRAGLPVALVAKAHDTSIQMIEAHYGAFIVSASEELMRRAVLPLAPSETLRSKP